MGAIAIYSSGMVTGVGLDAPSCCAAIRAGITGFVETRFMFDGEWLQGCPVALDEPWRGVEKLERLVAAAIGECLQSPDSPAAGEVPLLLCMAEPDRPGRYAGLGDGLLRAVEKRLGLVFHPESRVIAGGRVGGVQALDRSRDLLRDGRPACILAGVDSFLTSATLAAYAARRRLATAANSDGFIPGEAAAAVLVGPVRRQQEPQLMCLGLGFGTEPSPIGAETPLRGEGMVAAVRAAFADGRCGYDGIDYRITDNTGEAYGFKESALAIARTLRDLKSEFEIWHPGDCVGEIGAATVPTILAIALAASAKGYAPGAGALCHLAGDDGARAALVLHYRSWSGT